LEVRSTAEGAADVLHEAHKVKVVAGARLEPGHEMEVEVVRFT